MPKEASRTVSKYCDQRAKVPVPVVSTAVLRKALDKTLQDVCDYLLAEYGMKVERGTISAIENGHRGASIQMLTAYADALGVPASVIDTQYEPRRRGQVPAA